MGNTPSMFKSVTKLINKHLSVLYMGWIVKVILSDLTTFE